MRNVLAATMALMLAAAIISPVVGFSFQSGGSQSYSIGSAKVNYSISMGIPAQNLTLAMIPPAVSGTASVKVTPTPYSMKLGTSTYSMKLGSNISTTHEGLTTMPPIVALGSLVKG